MSAESVPNGGYRSPGGRRRQLQSAPADGGVSRRIADLARLASASLREAAERRSSVVGCPSSGNVLHIGGSAQSAPCELRCHVSLCGLCRCSHEGRVEQPGRAPAVQGGWAAEVGEPVFTGWLEEPFGLGNFPAEVAGVKGMAPDGLVDVAQVGDGERLWAERCCDGGVLQL